MSRSVIRLVVVLLSCGLMVACAHHRVDPNGETSENGSLVPKEVGAVANGDASEAEESSKIPVEINHNVVRWLNYFKGRGRKHMVRYLERSTQYSAMMRKTLKEEGLPEDLVSIVLIESGFNPVAHSHANAVGYWQFVRSTGQRYGLRVNALVDERRDPVASTHAAAQYFKSLYNL